MLTLGVHLFSRRHQRARLLSSKMGKQCCVSCKHSTAYPFPLDEIGKMHELYVALSIDGTSLTKNLFMIAGDIKVID